MRRMLTWSCDIAREKALARTMGHLPPNRSVGMYELALDDAVTSIGGELFVNDHSIGFFKSFSVLETDDDGNRT